MNQTSKLVLLVATFALVIASIAGVNAFGYIRGIEVNDVEVSYDNVATFAGDSLEVRVNFYAYNNAEDVRVKAWISGDSSLAASTERFDVLAGNLYSKVLSVKVPSNIDPSEEFHLFVSVENQDTVASQREVTLAAQRENYVVEFLDVAMDSKVSAGENLALDIVLKNEGRHLAEDTFVTAKIPALGISQRAYFGDLSAVDENIENGKEDAAERTMQLHIPSNVAPGIYDVVVQAFNADSDSTVTRKVAIDSGAGENTVLASAVSSKNAAVGEKAEYSFTLVNSGDNVRVYELALETSAGKELTLSANEPFVVIPAGSSKTVTVGATASEAGTYTFTAKVISNGQVAVEKDFALKAQGTKSTSVVANGNNVAVLLTVILAIVFVVLLVVLIVLLTRKPQKVEEFGESYY